ncbi:MAG: hypothetical protein BroJett001_32910 [Chloroflexota bacterium]|nr:MAG: hypothetical protein BroJett001_32910 [Chloroflexota bacterium]
MLALMFIPIAPRAAASCAPAIGGGTDGPYIDPDLIRVMDEKPEEQHAIILVARLSRAPFDLESMLPTPEEYNACTTRWLAWEDLQQRCEKGEDIAGSELEETERAAKEFDRSLVVQQEAAYEAHYWDYAAIVAQDVPQVLEAARAILGDRVRQLHEASQLLPATGTREEVEKLCGVPRLKAIWLDLPIEPQLDISRLSIEADRVHNGEVGGTPYTGAGVKVTVVDTGLAPDHPRLPVPTAANQKNFACRDGRDATDWCDLCALPGHGTNVAGVIFTQPDPCCSGGDCPGWCGGDCVDNCDALLGIAFDATPVIAKMYHQVPGPGCSCVRSCASCPNDYYPPTWSLIVEGLAWAATLPSQIGPSADVISCSLAAPSYSSYSDTSANHITSRNTDWIIQAGGAPMAQAAGNSGIEQLRAPAGAYNVVAVGNYAHNNTPMRSDDSIVAGSSGGPTFDGRNKPDLCAPGAQYISPPSGILTAHFCWTIPTPLFTRVGGTSIATPHVAGTIALMKESRPSLVPRQVHAILINSAEPLGSQVGWEGQPGWGQLNAYNAVRWRNRIVDGTVADPNDSKTHQLSIVSAGDQVVVTLTWQREMDSETDPSEDGNGNPSPVSLDLFLEGRLPGGDWSALTSDAPDLPSDGQPEDNVRKVTWPQNPQGQPQYEFRVRVEYNPTADTPYEASQSFTIASRHTFNQSP